MLTQDQVKSIFSYDEKTGILVPKNKEPSVYLDTSGYVKTTIKSHAYQVGVVAWVYVYGTMPKFTIDHADGNPSNNKISNLRDANITQQNQNRRIFKNNRTGYKGVIYDPVKRRWRAKITVNKKRKCLGLFRCPELAHEAYRKAAAENFGEFARL